MKAKVLRAFCINTKRQEPGAIVELTEQTGRELIALGKCERVRDESMPALGSPGPMTTESASELVKGKARKGEKDA